MIDWYELHQWLGVTDAGELQLLTELEARIVAYLQRTTGRYFGPPVQMVEILDGTGLDSLWLSEPPLVGAAIPSIPAGLTATAVDERDTPPNWIAVESTEYEIVRATLFRPFGKWSLGRRRWRVSYPTGYPAGKEPGDIRQAVFDLVRLAWGQRATVAAGGSYKSETFGDYSYTLSDTVGGAAAVAQVPGLQDTLDRWTRGWLR